MNHEYKELSTLEFLEILSDGREFKDILLKDADLGRTMAYDLDFQHCRFVNVNISDNNWDGLRCSASEFINCHFIASNMENAVLENCIFFDTENSTGCNFSRSNLTSAHFSECDISSCDFEAARLFKITIQDSKAIGTKFFRANFNNSVKLINN